MVCLTAIPHCTVSSNGNFMPRLKRDGCCSVLVRVLFVEDVETDAELAVRRLRSDGVPCAYKRVETEQPYLDALHTGDYDIILSDFSLPQFDGMSALALAKRERPNVPFIFLSGTIGEERAIEALRCGAVDYVLKSNLKRLEPAVTRALREAEQQNESSASPGSSRCSRESTPRWCASASGWSCCRKLVASPSRPDIMSPRWFHSSTPEPARRGPSPGPAKAANK
jgi:DNA-binding NtrC family response regulator